jgi:hypothetical protein
VRGISNVADTGATRRADLVVGDVGVIWCERHDAVTVSFLELTEGSGPLDADLTVGFRRQAPRALSDTDPLPYSTYTLSDFFTNIHLCRILLSKMTPAEKYCHFWPGGSA